jgi:hypothetical protein
MALTCNIDARGKAVRLRIGIGFLLVGLTLLGIGLLGEIGAWVYAASLALLVSGAFSVFEARAGWCVVRALGWKTPI